MASPIAQQGKFQLLTRLGLAARGLLYLTIGLLVLASGRTEDAEGALQLLATDVGKWLLAVLAAGFVAYGLWRLSEALFGMESGSGSAEANGKRVAAGFSGLVHLFLGYQAFHLWQGARLAGGGAERQAGELLELPGGALLLGAVAAALVVAGLFQLVDSARCSFLDRLTEGAGRRRWVKWLGRIGYAARGIVFLLCGVFLAQGALQSQPSEVGGVEQALDWLFSPLDLLVAAGLMLFGLFSLVETRFRRVPEPPVSSMAAKLVP